MTGRAWYGTILPWLKATIAQRQGQQDTCLGPSDHNLVFLFLLLLILPVCGLSSLYFFFSLYLGLGANGVFLTYHNVFISLLLPLLFHLDIKHRFPNVALTTRLKPEVMDVEDGHIIDHGKVVLYLCTFGSDGNRRPQREVHHLWLGMRVRQWACL
jgi:hypothetical protein